MPATQAVVPTPFPQLLKVGVRHLVTALWPTGGQGRSRHNAAQALDGQRARSRESTDAWLAMVAADEQWQALLRADRAAALRFQAEAEQPA